MEVAPRATLGVSDEWKVEALLAEIRVDFGRMEQALWAALRVGGGGMEEAPLATPAAG